MKTARTWRTVIVLAGIIGVGAVIELCTSRGLSTNMMELLKWGAITYLANNLGKGVASLVKNGGQK